MHRILSIGLAAMSALVFSASASAWSWPADGAVLRPFALGADAYAAGQHRGVDVAGPDGSAVRAPAGGVVTFAGSLPTYGRGVTIGTTDGYAVTLVHLGEIAVAKGDTVDEGAVVGTMGTSGTPEHAVPSVHLGIRRDADEEGYVDPLGLLPARAEPAPAPSPEPTGAPAAASATAAAQQPSPPAPAASATPTPSTSPAAPPPAQTTAVPLVPSTETAATEAGQPAAEPTLAASSAPEPETPAATPAEAGISIRAAEAPAAMPIAAEPPGGVDVSRNEVTASQVVAAPAPVPASRALVPPSVASPSVATHEPTAHARVMPRHHVADHVDPRAVVGSVGEREPRATHVLEHVEPVDPVFAQRAAAVVPPASVAEDATRGSRVAALAPRDERTAEARTKLATESQRDVTVRAETPVRNVRRGLPAVAAALALVVLVAAAVGRRVARRIGLDGAVLRHHADLLRQLDAAHRARLHDRGRRRVRPPSAAART